MHQEINAVPSTKKSDLLLFFAMLLLAVIASLVRQLLAALPMGGVWQLLLFAALVALCYGVYRTRLCSYRYTICHEQPPEGELDEYGQPAQNPYPLGMLVIERMTGDKAKFYEAVKAGEMRALLAPGENLPAESGAKKGKTFLLTPKSKKTAHCLVYERNGAADRIYFHPSQELCRILEEVIAAVRGA